MPRPRSYRHDIRCPHCGSNWMPKDGHSYGKQTYRCGECKYRYTPDGNRHFHPEKTVSRALDCYKEGMSVSAIARAMGVSYVTVYGWVKKSPRGDGDNGHGARAAQPVRGGRSPLGESDSGHGRRKAEGESDLIR